MSTAKASKIAFVKSSIVKSLVVSTFLALLVVTVIIIQKNQQVASTSAVGINTTGLRAYPPRVGPGVSVTVQWYTTQPTPNNWIGLFKFGAANSSYLLKKYTRECQVASLPSAQGGTCYFAAPKDLGSYEFRMFRGNLKIATSNQVDVALLPSPTPVPITYYPTLYPTKYPTPPISPKVTPVISCFPPPPCVMMVPPCEIPEPEPGWCPSL